jgi:hypothetical protein
MNIKKSIKTITITLEGDKNNMGFIIDGIGSTLNYFRDDFKDGKITMKINNKVKECEE